MSSTFPSGWIIVQLRDIAKWGSGGTPPRGNQSYYGGSIPWIKTGELGPLFVTQTEENITDEGLRNSSAKLFPRGAVAIAMYGATIGKTSILGIDAATNQACAVGVPHQNLTTSKYLYYYLRSQKDAFIDAGKGGAQPNISQAIIKEWAAPLPPFKEQMRITDKLDVLIDRVEACRKRIAEVPSLLDRFRDAVLAAATSGRLTQEWRQRNGCERRVLIEEIARQKLSWAQNNPNHNEAARVRKRAEGVHASIAAGSSDLPEGWCWAPIEDAMLMIVDCHNKTAPYTSSGIPLVRTSNVRQGEIVWEEMRFVNDETFAYWSRRCPPEPGDIIFTREAPVAEAAVIPDGMHPCLGQRTMLFRPPQHLCATRYLLFAILDPGFKARALEATVGTGVKHLRVGDVSELLIPLPPTEEQFEIARRASALLAMADEVEESLQLANDNIEHLIPTLLAKAFRGELVPQDPNDEPAAELLRRIQKAAGEVVTSGKSKLPTKEKTLVT